MPPVVDLSSWAAPRETAQVEAIPAKINRGTRPDKGRQPGAVARAERDINAKAFKWPTAQEVATLAISHGVEAAWERWGYVSRKELRTLARKGGLRACWS